jgi:crotonobetainyl-CoA:carnitine CoA-transferase CaiB-like acyl-CoA transferase
MTRRPLDGVRIFDMTIFMVGPWATMLLGALGAEVLHVEQPDVDWKHLSAGVPPTINGTSIGYLAWNMNKRCLFLDLKQDGDRQFAYELIDTCDVFVCNMRAGVPERLGMGYDELAARNPQLVYVRGTGYGPTGPRSGERAADNVIQALAGFWSTQGRRGGAGEAYRHYTQLDAVTGNTMAQAVLLGLYSRRRTGRGQLIDVTMFDAAATLQAPRLAEHLAGRAPVPQGSSAFATAPDRAFRCEDGRWIGVSVTSEDEWAALCDAAAVPELRDDARYRSNRDRVAHAATLEERLEAVFARRPQSFWAHALARAGVPNGIPLDWEALRHHRQVVENNYVVEIETPAWGKVWTGGPPWHLSKTPAQMGPPPIPGDDTFDLRAELGATEAASG